MLAPTLGCPRSGVYTLHCFKDMTARDLLQRRATDAYGNTRWEPSPLLRACWAGGILVLDGLHRLKPEVLVSLASLLQDGSTQLFDGERLLRVDRFAEVAGARWAGGRRDGGHRSLGSQHANRVSLYLNRFQQLRDPFDRPRGSPAKERSPGRPSNTWIGHRANQGDPRERTGFGNFLRLGSRFLRCSFLLLESKKENDKYGSGHDGREIPNRRPIG